MVNVRKRGHSFEYRIEIATIDGTRKWISKSGYKNKQEVYEAEHLHIRNTKTQVFSLNLVIYHIVII